MKTWLLVMASLLVLASPRESMAQKAVVPVISGAQAGPGADLVPGDTLSVLAQGTVGMKGTFDIGTRTNQRLIEDPGGIYRGTYHITADDHFRSTPVIVRLTSPSGQSITKATELLITVGVKLDLQSVNIDATGPVEFGDMVTVTVKGTPGVQASASAGGQNVNLRETAPGTYTGSFRVGTDTHTGRVTATLTHGTRTANKDGPMLNVNSGH